MSNLDVGQKSPSCHGGSRNSLDILPFIVTILILPEASIFMLHLFQPLGYLGYPRFTHVVAHFCQTWKYSSNCIDIVDRPPGTPHPVFSVVEKILHSFHSHLYISNLCLRHPLKDMPHDVRTRRVEYLSTFVDLSHPEDKRPKFILPVVLVFVECRETSIIILSAPHPRITSINFFEIIVVKLAPLVKFLQLSVQNKQHSSIINIRCILELMTIRNPAVRLDSSFNQIAQSWMQFLRSLSSFKQGISSQDGVPVSSIIKGALIRNSLVEVHVFNVGH